MMRQLERQIKNRKCKQITHKQVWPSLTEGQQAQFVETIETICQRLASRQMREEEGDDAIS